MQGYKKCNKNVISHSYQELEDETHMKNKALSTNWTLSEVETPAWIYINTFKTCLLPQKKKKTLPLLYDSPKQFFMCFSQPSTSSTEVVIRASWPRFCFYFLLSPFVPL